MSSNQYCYIYILILSSFLNRSGDDGHMDSKTLVTAPPKEAEIGPLAKTVGGKGGPGGSEACHLLPQPNEEVSSPQRR